VTVTFTFLFSSTTTRCNTTRSKNKTTCVLKCLRSSVDSLHRQTFCTLSIKDSNFCGRIISCLKYRLTLRTYLSNPHNVHQILQVRVRQTVMFRRNLHTQHTETREAVSVSRIVTINNCKYMAYRVTTQHPIVLYRRTMP
jgi:hypothetical protein